MLCAQLQPIPVLATGLLSQHILHFWAHPVTASPISASTSWVLQPKQDLQLDFLIIFIF